MKESVLIPRERVSVLIGKSGKVKRDIEESGRCELTVRDDVVWVEGNPEDVFRVLDVVKAVGRGFSPETAVLLLNDEYAIKVITLKGETEKTVRRLMGRVIGRKGATRRIIEESTGCKLSVYGKTVSVIGEANDIPGAVRAVEDLLSGHSHGYAYRRMKK